MWDLKSATIVWKTPARCHTSGRGELSASSQALDISDNSGVQLLLNFSQVLLLSKDYPGSCLQALPSQMLISSLFPASEEPGAPQSAWGD